MYSEMRHPFYAGVMLDSVGLAVATGSAMRLLLKAALWILFDVMVEFEEGALLDEYTARVPTKFVPSAFLDLLEG